MSSLSWILAALVGLGVMSPMAADSVLAQEKPVVQNQQDDTKTAMDPAQVLPASVEQRFKAIRFDPDPDQLVRDAHYWVSNENAHYVWYNYIKDKGGVFSGVGTDQVYLLAGWANAAMILPMDFDRQIKNLHLVYGAAFMSAENIQDFRSYWQKDSADKIKSALQKYFPDDVDGAMKAWKSGRGEVAGRFNRVVKKYTKGEGAGIPTFLTDESQYQRIRQLWLNHRVFPICGDLTGDKSMIDIAKALNDSGLKMTFLYPSNAEHYFVYGPAYRRNIINMPFSDNSLILRTRQMKSLGLAEEGDYHYDMQSGENFKIWMQTTNIPDQHKMLRKRSKTSTEGLSVMDYVPEPSAKAPEIAPMPQ